MFVWHFAPSDKILSSRNKPSSKRKQKQQQQQQSRRIDSSSNSQQNRGNDVSDQILIQQKQVINHSFTFKTKEFAQFLRDLAWVSFVFFGFGETFHFDPFVRNKKTSNNKSLFYSDKKVYCWEIFGFLRKGEEFLIDF